MVWKPRVTVASIIEKDGRFLMVEEEEDRKTVLNQPAGHLEEGESLTNAAIRETLEETGWEFCPQALVGIYRWVHPGNGLTFLRICFSGYGENHDPNRPLDEGILRAIWLSRAELADAEKDNRMRSPLVMQCIDDYLSGQHYPLTLLKDLELTNQVQCSP